MYTAVILACHAIMSGACFQLVDNRGPYPTAEQCEVRIEEMVKDTIVMWHKHNAPILVKGWKCEQDVGT